MTRILTADEFDEMFDSGEDMDDYIDWDDAVDEPVPSGPVVVAVRMELNPAVLSAIDRKAAKAGKTRTAFMEEAIGAALATT